MPHSMNAADIHLGYRQYGSNDRWNDYGRAFSWLIDEAISRKVCCLRISGDLFDSNTMTARTLLQATANLQRAKLAGITTIIIPGNHDRPGYSDPFSWLDYLVEQELLILLDPQFRDGDIVLQPWQREQLHGSYFDCPLCHTRTIGVRFYAAVTSPVVAALVRALAAMATTDRPYTVLMLHAGIEGMLPHYQGGLTMAEVEPLRPYVDCLALGHIHKPGVIDDWIYNPGSLETCSIDESTWSDRGYFLLDIDPGPERTASVVQVPYSRRRSFLQFAWPMDTYPNPERLYADLRGCMTDEAMNRDRSDRPVLELRLQGVLKFPRAALDIAEIQRILTDLFQPIVCLVRDLTEPPDSQITLSETTSRAELERQVLQQLVRQDSTREAQADGWVATVRELKDMALRRAGPEGIIEETQSHIDRIRFMEAEVGVAAIEASFAALTKAGAESIDKRIMGDDEEVQT